MKTGFDKFHKLYSTYRNKFSNTAFKKITYNILKKNLIFFYFLILKKKKTYASLYISTYLS